MHPFSAVKSQGKCKIHMFYCGMFFFTLLELFVSLTLMQPTSEE